jgi:hypothetical protein
MFLSWFPKYLHAARGFNLQQMGLYANGTYLSSREIRK